MYYLIPIPFIFLAAIVYAVSNFFQLKIIAKIAKFVIIVGVIAFIFTFLDCQNINIIKILKDFFVTSYNKIRELVIYVFS